MYGDKKKTHCFKKTDTVKYVKNYFLKNIPDSGKRTSLLFNGHIIDEEEENSIEQYEKNSEIKIEINEISFNASDTSSKIKKKIIEKTISDCEYHKENKKLLICVDCRVAICDKCSDKHEGHKKLEKMQLINYGKELKKINNKFNEFGLPKKNGINDFCKDERREISSSIKQMANMVQQIENTSKKLNNSFNNNFEKINSLLLDYEEKVKKLNEKSLQMETIKKEDEFIDYYFQYKNLKDNEKKINDYLTTMNKSIEFYKKTLQDFQLSLNNILSNSKNDYNKIMNYRSYDINITSLRNNRDYSLSLKNIINPVCRQEILKKETTSILEDKKKKESKVKKLYNENDAHPNLVIGLELNTKNIFIFDKKNNSITKEEISDPYLDKFQEFYVTLNYKGRFFISGQNQNQNNIYKLNLSKKTLEKLESMPTPHRFHGMIGIKDDIFAVSGFKNKCVEKYEIDKNNWVPVDSLETSISYPGCISSDEQFLYVFGGMYENSQTENKNIYKLDIKNSNANWEKMEINSDLKYIPIYSGLVQIKPKEYLILGGKIGKNYITQSYKLDLENNTFSADNEYVLSNKEKFNKKFYDLGGGIFGEFSLLSSDKFYRVDSNYKKIDFIQCK